MLFIFIFNLLYQELMNNTFILIDIKAMKNVVVDY